MTENFEKFMAAVENNEDDLAEQLVQNLSKGDESALMELVGLAALHVRYPTVVQPLLSNLGRCLADGEGFVRQSAVDSLAKCGDDALDTLADVLAASHEGARTRAAITLRKIASMGAAALLFRYLNDSNYLVHTYCNEALDEMGLLDNILVAV